MTLLNLSTLWEEYEYAMDFANKQPAHSVRWYFYRNAANKILAQYLDGIEELVSFEE